MIADFQIYTQKSLMAEGLLTEAVGRPVPNMRIILQ